MKEYPALLMVFVGVVFLNVTGTIMPQALNNFSKLYVRKRHKFSIFVNRNVCVDRCQMYLFRAFCVASSTNDPYVFD